MYLMLKAKVFRGKVHVCFSLCSVGAMSRPERQGTERACAAPCQEPRDSTCKVVGTESAEEGTEF